MERVVDWGWGWGSGCWGDVHNVEIVEMTTCILDGYDQTTTYLGSM